MKKISIEIMCDEFYTVESLLELASMIENDDSVLEKSEISGDHYTAEIETIDVLNH